MTTEHIAQEPGSGNEASTSALPAVRNVPIGDNTVLGVDARDLHTFLGSGKDFSTWIKDRIAQYGFAEGVDYEAFEAAPQNGGAGNRGLRREYVLTLDMAKEIAMVDRSEKGKEVRRYFIECERRALDPAAALAAALSDPVQARALLLQQVERNAELQGQIEEMKPQVAAFDRIARADGSLCLMEAAKAMQMRPKDFIAFLNQNGWIYKRAGGANWLGYSSRTVAGLLEHKVTTVLRPDGSEKVTEQVRVTPKGLAKLAKLVPSRLALVEAA